MLNWLNLFDYGFDINYYNKLREKYTFLDKIYSRDFKVYLNEENIEILKDIYEYKLKKEKDLLEKNNIKLISILDDIYPLSLKEINNPPLFLYLKGNTEILENNKKNIGIFGTKNPSNLGIKILEDVYKVLKNKEFNLVTTVNEGVEDIIFRKLQKESIVVLAGGMNFYYPKYMEKMLKEKNTKHLFISEFPLNYIPRRKAFRMRNRIISGILNDLILTETTTFDVSYIIANLAFLQDKNIYTFSSNMYDKSFVGNLKLIRENKAMLISSIEDILKEIII